MSSSWYSNCEEIEEVWKPLDKHAETMIKTSRAYYDANGVIRITGTADLKSTQAYPPKFGQHVAGAWRSAVLKHPMGEGMPLESLGALECEAMDWPDANLQQIAVDMGLM